MRILTSIPPRFQRNPREVAAHCRASLFSVVESNVKAIHDAKRKGRPIPDLYESGIVFLREPWAGQFEEFAPIDVMLARGWGDCDDCAAYRCAEYWARGGPWLKTGIKIYWRLPKPGVRMTIFHAQVRLPNGKIEDPSRRLPGG